VSIPEPLEKETQAAVRRYLLFRGAFPVRVNSAAFKVGGRYVRANSEPGCSDLLVCYRGRFVAFEVKREGNYPTVEQQSFLDAVNRAGGVGCVVRSVDDAAAVLDRIDQEAGL
jgi:protein involved in polysaccharide export with SLBB domain